VLDRHRPAGWRVERVEQFVAELADKILKAQCERVGFRF